MRLFLLTSSAGLLMSIAAPAQIVPVGITNSSFTGDAILEAPDAADIDLSWGRTDGASDVLVTQGYASQSVQFDPNDGVPQDFLPDDGTITTSNGATFQLQPYDAANVAVINSGDSVTLQLLQPAAFSELSFLLSNRTSRGGGDFLQFTLNYVGGAPIELTSADHVPSWKNVTSESVAQEMLLEGDTAVGPVQLDEYDFNVDPSAGLLESITFHAGSNNLDIFAVSGIDPVLVPEPSTWAMMVGMGFMFIVLRRRSSALIGW